MGKYKRLVYIEEINSKTWLLLTKAGQSTCLRDYATSPPTKVRSFSADEIEAMLKKAGNFQERIPPFTKVSIEDEDFWRSEIQLRNDESALNGPVETTRLQAIFKEDIKSALASRNEETMAAAIHRWKKRFEMVKDKKQFNHWDGDSAISKISATTGLGWTSQLLEESRRGGVLNYLPTGCDETKFSLVAMELSLGISSKANPFPGEGPSYIKPDGLGVRSSGHFTILEVKGPQDEAGLVGPMLQAACGALAVVAKRKMILDIARSAWGLRPACRNARLPKKKRTIGIHVLTQADENGGPREPWTKDVEDACLAILKAFEELKYIAYSFVTRPQAANLTRLDTNYLITVDGVVKR